MSDEQQHPKSEPRMADLSTKPAPVPGPLTKPMAVVRPARKGRRALAIAAVVLAIILIVVAFVLLITQNAAAPEGAAADAASAVTIAAAFGGGVGP